MTLESVVLVHYSHEEIAKGYFQAYIEISPGGRRLAFSIDVEIAMITMIVCSVETRSSLH